MDKTTARLRDIPDFPRPGILFKDITPVLNDPAAFAESVQALTQAAQGLQPDVIAGVESRGFLFGAPIALNLGLGFVPVRKVGKLPHATLREEYTLEYGTNTLEMHTDSLVPGQRVVIVDDLLATGGTARATARLVERAGGVVVGFCFLVELTYLNGRALLGDYPVAALLTFGE